jgi:phosphate transport system substrate-binding protein
LIVEEVPASALDLQTTDLAIQLGEPPILPPFSALIAWDEVVLVLHPSNPVSYLTTEEIENLFSGQIDNWGQIRGTHLDVQVWVGMNGDEAHHAFQSYFLSDASLLSTAHLAPGPQAMFEAVSSEQGAVGYLPQSWVTNDVNVLPLDIRLPVLALANAEPMGAPRMLLSCLQDSSGQGIITDHFIPLDG